jgi:Poly(ADP-ribose) polymerase catalytic domain
MFGRAIYTTSVSSKADIYAKNRYAGSRMHAMLLCLVSVGKAEEMFSADHSKKNPSYGYDSVEAVTKPHGGAVEYPETAVYSEGAIIPIGLIIYTRE